MDLAKYSWWGEINEPPEHLKTKKQLGELGLSLLKPSGVIPTRKYDVFLCDSTNPESCRPKRKLSPKQLETLAANRIKAQIKRDYQEWYREVGFIERDRVRAAKWAREQLIAPDEWLILDTKTTGLDHTEIVEIAVINPLGEALLNTLVRPAISIPAEVTEIHGITDEDVKDAPTFPEIYPSLAEVMKDKRVLIYNSVFDIASLFES